ncbi:MAG: hypothetical protein IKU36_04570 [Bacteroidales bacterium]|nr:hypothetical protein [Bacteroidales bacterium]
MKKIFAILLILFSFNISVNAQKDRFNKYTFGVEWGYVATFQSGYRYIFFPPEGYRVDVMDNSFGLHNNADVYIHSGLNLNKNWNLSIYAGYAGVSDIHKVIPVSLRGTRYFGKDPLKDRWFAFVDFGSGICIKRPVQEILAGKIGGGYRMSLSRYSKLDFIFAVRMTYTHPQITYDQEVIVHDMIRRNNAYVSAFSVGIGLTF